MIQAYPKRATSPACSRREVLLTLAGMSLVQCAAGESPVKAYPPPPPTVTDGYFLLRDGIRLPYRQWLPLLAPGQKPRATVLALHGFNDSRDAWEIPAPWFTRAGFALIAPDQRGFGASPGRGRWPGTETLVYDAADIAGQIRLRAPEQPFFLMGESMGAAVLMCLADKPFAPPAKGYVLVAPAVWGRAEMNPFYRGALWSVSTFLPWMKLTGRAAKVLASDNRDALIRLSTDPLTIHETRMDTLAGLVDLMDAALDAAKDFPAPALVQYGGHDELVPAHAMRRVWRRLAASGNPAVRFAYYPAGYHLLLRDHERAKPLGDIIAWLNNPEAPLPSGADHAARLWLQHA